MTRLALLLALPVAVGVPACENPFGSGREVVLAITEVRLPSEAAAGSAFQVHFQAMEGGCVRFSHLETRRAESSLQIRAWGRDSSRRSVHCTTDVRFVAQAVSVDPPFHDPFSVTILQPTGQRDRYEVRIR
jgi:hypothetical protein